jgi:tRNA A37 N6-isopentenylltransferase MiaA
MINKVNAIQSLKPNTEWVLRGDELEWLDENTTAPTEEQIQSEIVRLQSEYDSKEYQRKRAAEYPDFKDYLDGIVKGDAAQVQAYIDACNAVKAKYPKGE